MLLLLSKISRSVWQSSSFASKKVCLTQKSTRKKGQKLGFFLMERRLLDAKKYL